jgi:mono/diheme cytochrome c family protein
LRRLTLTTTIRSSVVLALAVSLASAVGFAQSSGEATYKAKCQGCHGATGAGDTVTGKIVGVKPLSDPEVKKYTADQMLDIVRNGKNKMQAFKDKLTEAEIKASVVYFRSLIK